MFHSTEKSQNTGRDFSDPGLLSRRPEFESRLALHIPQSPADNPKGLGFSPLEPAANSISFREIPLTKNKVALVDDEDFARFGHLKWTAGSFNSKLGYAYRSQWGADGKCRTILLHRLILGAEKGQIVDHINGDTFDCRRFNLRLATYAQNRFNSRTKPARFGFIGVDSQTPDRYRGRVTLAKRTFYTKTYLSPILAACARDVLAQQLHGEFSVLNFQFIPIPQGGGQ